MPTIFDGDFIIGDSGSFFGIKAAKAKTLTVDLYICRPALTRLAEANAKILRCLCATVGFALTFSNLILGGFANLIEASIFAKVLQGGAIIGLGSLSFGRKFA